MSPRSKEAKPCIFCAIVKRELPAEIVLETEDCVAFLDYSPLLPGHCLVVPRSHIETFMDIPQAQTGPLFVQAQRLARALEKVLGGDGIFVGINNRISQSVPHVHIHVVPRWKKDGLFSQRMVWKRQKYASETAMHEIADRIRASL